MNPFARRLFVGLLALLSAALPGCSGERHPKTAVVIGKVTYKGKPLSQGRILFVPVTPGTTATGEIQSDGTYSLTTFTKGDGAILGKHKVAILSMADVPDAVLTNPGYVPPPLVPDKYTSPATTDLEAEVKEGENHLNFDLIGELYKPRNLANEPPTRMGIGK